MVSQMMRRKKKQRSPQLVCSDVQGMGITRKRGMLNLLWSEKKVTAVVPPHAATTIVPPTISQDKRHHAG